MRRTTPILILIFLVAAAGQLHAATAGFPLNPGNRWEYRRHDGAVDTLSISRCQPFKNIPVCEATFNGERSFYLIPTTSGLFRLNFDPASAPSETGRNLSLLIGDHPLTEGSTWSAPWGDRPLVFKTVAVEDFALPSGVVDGAAKIGYREPTNPIYSGFMWYMPGVGIVAQEEGISRSELAVFTPSEMLPPEPVDIGARELATLLGFSPPQAAGTDGSTSREGSGYLLHVLMAVVIVMGAVVIILLLRRGGGQMDLSGSDEVSEGEMMVARSMVKEGLYGEAVQILEKLTRHRPDWPDLAAELGRAYLEGGMVKEASMELKRALTLNADLTSARVDLARALLACGEPAGAMAEAETVLAENPAFADALYLKGEAVLMLGNSQVARELFNEALELNPHFRRAREALAGLKDD